MSAEVARTFTAKAEEMTANIHQRGADLTRLLDERTGSYLTAFGAQGQRFSTEIERVTNQAVQSIEAKGITFSKTMLQNSQEITTLINDAGSKATTSVTRTLKELDQAARSVVENSQKTASSAVSEMVETHGMLRNDTAALFERLREANGLLQEVLSGATENLGMIETALAKRVNDFVVTMNEVADRTGSTNRNVEEKLGAFHSVSGTALENITQMANKFEEHGRALASAPGGSRSATGSPKASQRPPRSLWMRCRPDSTRRSRISTCGSDLHGLSTGVRGREARARAAAGGRRRVDRGTKAMPTR